MCTSLNICNVMMNICYVYYYEHFSLTQGNSHNNRQKLSFLLLPPDPISVRAVTVTPPVAESAYSLECAGAKAGASIQWTQNGKALSTSAIVSLSDSNVTLTFSALSPSDTGSYQCIVREQGEVIPGVPYVLNVICECTVHHSLQ